MSGNKPKLNSYSLLQMKMKEVEKTKNPNRPAANSNSNKPKETKEKKKEQEKKPAAPDPSKEQHRLNPNIPDRSFGDFFCKICDSHMNSDAMWEAHITGKRHIKNVKKGDTDSKYDEIDEESSINIELQNVKDPIIGLSYIHEIRRKDPKIPAMYNCFLCHASIATIPLVIEHVTGLKHRLNFIKENEPEEFELLESTNLKKNHLEPLAAETAARLEAKLGRGEVKVKVEKPKPAIPYKRSYDSDDDDIVLPKKTSKPQKFVDSSVAVWSSLDTRESNERRREKDYYYHDERDGYRSSRSYRDSLTPERDHSRRSERDNYSRSYADDYLSRSVSYPTDYLRSDSSRYDYDRSPDRDRLPSISARKDDYYRSSSYDSPRFESDVRALHTPSSSARQSIDPTTYLTDFMSQLKALPTTHFLKIVLMKLQDMPEMNKTELELLMKVFTNCQQVVCSNLPPQIQALFKDKVAQHSAENMQTSRNAVSSSASNTGRSSAGLSRMSQGRQGAENNSDKFVNDLNELLFGARKASEVSSSDNQQTHSTTYDHGQNIPPASTQFPGPAAANNFPPPPSFQPQNTFGPPLSNFGQSPARFQPPARFPPPRNDFTSNNAAAPYSSYAPFDANPPAAAIPGLTLAERDTPQYKWANSNRDIPNFRRF